jgi:hypothetical protein
MFKYKTFEVQSCDQKKIRKIREQVKHLIYLQIWMNYCFGRFWRCQKLPEEG